MPLAYLALAHGEGQGLVVLRGILLEVHQHEEELVLASFQAHGAVLGELFDAASFALQIEMAVVGLPERVKVDQQQAELRLRQGR